MIRADISPELERFVEAAIKSGQFRDRAHIMDEALRLLRKRDELRRDVDAGVEQLDRGMGLAADDVFPRLTEKSHRHTERDKSGRQ